jgi:hypothetical protein
MAIDWLTVHTLLMEAHNFFCPFCNIFLLTWIEFGTENVHKHLSMNRDSCENRTSKSHTLVTKVRK